jgi:WD40 repeat protein/tetratricopeptide (TPR) repeat protein
MPNARQSNTFSVPPEAATLPPPDSGANPPAEAATLPALSEALPDRPVVQGYEILEVLGRGGMGVVYKARQLSLNRLVALKMILAGSHASPQDLLRFRSEAEAVAHLQHPNIVQIYEVGERGGLPYFSLEFVDGGSLDQKLDGTPLPERQAAELMSVLARAIQAAHQRGIVHRDLKPGNVLLTLEGTPKITDFGLAKRLDSGVQQTQTGVVVGTPSYMAPEQGSGKTHEIGPAADIYALGAILYELLTGRPPFKAATPLDTVLQVIGEEPVPPSRLQPKVPRDLETICLKCLQKEPGKRYATALELAEDLDRFGRGEPIRARPVGNVERLWRWAKRNPGKAFLGAAVVVLLLTVAFGSSVAAFLVNQAREDEKRARIASDEAKDHATEAKRAAEQAQAQEAAQAEQNRRLLVRFTVANGTRLLQENDLSGALPWFSKALQLDRGTAATEEAHRTRLGQVWRQAPKFVHLWRHHGSIHRIALSPDGRLAATGSDDGTAQVWDLSTGKSVGPLLKHDKSVYSVAFSPDSKLLATCGGAIGQSGEIQVWEVGTSHQVCQPMRGKAAIMMIGFLADGNRLMTLDMDPLGAGATARIWQLPSGKPLRSITVKGFEFLNLIDPPYLSFASGRLLRSQGHSVQVYDLVAGRELPNLLRCTQQVYFAALSPDGQRVLTAAHSAPDEPAKMQVWDAATGQKISPPIPYHYRVRSVVFQGDHFTAAYADGSLQTFETLSGQPRFAPIPVGSHVLAHVFSPDGRFVAELGHEGTARIWNSKDKAWEAATPILHLNTGVTTAVFSPDGRRFFTGGADGTTRQWDLATVELARLTLGSTYSGAVGFTPDGQQVVTAGKEGMAVFDVRNGAAVGRSPLKGDFQAFQLEATARRLAAGSYAKTAQVWDTATGKALCPPLKHDRAFVWEVCQSPNGRYLATLSADSLDPRLKYFAEARLWDIEKGTLIASRTLNFGGRISGLTSPAFSPDSQLFALGGGLVSLSGVVQGEVRLFDPATGTKIGRSFFLGSGLAPLRIVFSADSSRIAVAGLHMTGKQSEVYCWDVASGKLLFPPLSFPTFVQDLAFDRSGWLLMTVSRDQIAVWRTATGKPAYAPLKLQATIGAAGFSQDGGALFATCHDDTVRIWDAQTGEVLTPPVKQFASVAAAALSPDGRRLAVGCTDGILRVWDLTAENRPVEDLERMARLLGCREVVAAGTVPVAPDVLAQDWDVLRTKYPDDFVPTKGRISEWHIRQANACQAEGEWSSVIVHADRLIEQAPEDGLLWALRALAHAVLRQYPQAAADYEESLKRRPDDAQTWILAATVQLALQDVAGHRRCCQEILRRFSNTSDPSLAEWLAKTCLVAPGAVDDLAPALKLAEKAVEGGPRVDRFFWKGLTKGIAEYRAGHWDQAVSWLDKARKQTTKQRQCDALAEVFLAMAQHRLGQTEKVKELLADAEKVSTDQNVADGNWVDETLLRAALPEARKVLSGPPGKAR